MSTLVGKKAPDFSATAVINGNQIVQNFSLAQYLREKYVILFFYPKDFTFVCPTEIWAFQNRLEDFKNKNVEVVGCSTESEYSHLAWLNTPRNNGGIKGVTFPLVSDINKTISESFGVLAGEYVENSDGGVDIHGEQVAYRGLFLIYKNGIVQHCLINNMSLGRSVDEALRMVDALQHFEKYGEVCPANWHPGEKPMSPTQEGLLKYFDK